MKVLVIGGSGFIGTRLIDVLGQRGVDVVNLDLRPSARHPELTCLGDVRDAARVAEVMQGCSAVVLLAAEHRDDVRPASLYEDVNVGGARVVAQCAAALGVQRVVFTSTVAVYGLDVASPDEQTVPRPFNEYGRTKLEAERVLTAWAEQDPERSLVVVRPCVVFGEGNRGNVYTLLRQIASGAFLPVGDGQNRKSMAYVGNVAAFLGDQLGAPPGVSVVNYADGPDLTTSELMRIVDETLYGRRRRRPRLPLVVALAVAHVLDLVARVTGRTFPVSVVRIRKFVAETTVGTSRLRASGFSASVPLETGLRRTLRAEFPDRVRVDTEQEEP